MSNTYKYVMKLESDDSRTCLSATVHGALLHCFLDHQCQDFEVVGNKATVIVDNIASAIPRFEAILDWELISYTRHDETVPFVSKNTLNNLEFLITDWSEKKGILKYGSMSGQMGKLQEEFDELKDGLFNKDPAEIADAVGDMIVVLNNIAVMNQTTLTNCLNGAYNEIKDRKGQMKSDGKFHKE